MNLIENFISNKVYDALYLDGLLKIIWESVTELWQIGGSARPAALVFLLLMLIIILIPLLPFIAIGYFLYKLNQGSSHV